MTPENIVSQYVFIPFLHLHTSTSAKYDYYIRPRNLKTWSTLFYNLIQMEVKCSITYVYMCL